MSGQELQVLEGKSGVQSATSDAKEHTLFQTVHDADTLALARSGKKQVLVRRFGLVSMTGFSSGLMCTWESVLVVFLLGLQNGGPGGLIYGFIFVWIGTTSVFATIGELASMEPTAAGQYHWINTLAGQGWKKFWSYILGRFTKRDCAPYSMLTQAGWVTLISWIASTTAAAFFASSLMLALAALNNPEYEVTGWQGTLVFWAVLLAAALLNTVGGKILPVLEVMILVLHVLGFFAIFIPLISLSEKVDTSDVFTGVSSQTGWLPGLAFFIGLNGNAAAFLGTDGPVHMSEEVKNAQRNVPRSMLLSLVINGVLAFGLLIAVLYCTVNLDDAVNNAPNGFPFVLILVDGVGSAAGASVMTAIVLILEFCSTVGSLAGGSRIVWSFARDNGMPWSAALSKVRTD